KPMCDRREFHVDIVLTLLGLTAAAASKFLTSAARSCSLPPCGGGLGRGVNPRRLSPCAPPSPALRGGGSSRCLRSTDGRRSAARRPPRRRRNRRSRRA